jgi:oxygen-independent coproporphyrinogen III oxidase
MQQVKNADLPKSLYLHIPFCDHICHYCDFTKMLTNPKLTLNYVHQLLAEVKTYSQFAPFETIFFGGGTPTALNANELKTLCDGVAPYFKTHGEWSVECNVESTTIEKLVIMKQAGVNRLSFGVQTFKPSALKALNRHHNQTDIYRVIGEAKNLGFTNINVDLIYDLPHVSDTDLYQDLQAFIDLDVDHIATYALTIHPHTVFGIQKVPQVSDDISRRHYETIFQFLNDHGYERYEVSNFARNQRYAQHNLTYWRNQAYVGCGLGASGYIEGIRYTNTKNITKYLTGIRRDQEEVITPAMKAFEYLMLNLRLKKGFLLKEYEDIFAESFVRKFEKPLLILQSQLLINTTNESVFLTDEGMLLLDYVVLKLTKDII